MLTIDGMFPSIPTQGKPYFCTVRYNVLEILSNGSVKWIGPDEMSELIQDDCNRARARDAGNFLASSGGASWFGPYNCTLSGKIVKIPSYVNAELFPRIKSNTGLRWSKRTRTNDIILTNHTRGSLQIDFVPGLGTLTSYDGQISSNIPAKNLGLWPVDNKNGYVYIKGRVFMNFNVNKYYRRMIRVQNVDPRPPGWNPKSYEWLVKAKLISLEPDTLMVTSTLAKANSGTVELLSTLAETPQTVIEIINAVKAILKMYKDARAKAFRLYNKGGAGSPANTLWRNSKEFAQAVADVWMTWRFSIRPNEYLLNDLIDIYYSKAQEFIRFREKTFTSFTIPSPGLPPVSSAEVSAEHRCMIKRLFDVSRPEALVMQRFALNGVIALYELTPFSWMADYFVNLGDWAASLFNITPALAEGSTLSWQVKNAVRSFGSDETGFINVTLSVYRRDVIDPSALTCIKFNPDLDASKIADISAVMWNVFKKDLPRDIIRRLN
jgi:hypothetical protein